MCGISCHNNTKFLRAIAEVCLYLIHKKMEQLRVFAAWHHNWKSWGQNHDIYSHYTSTTIYTLCRYKVFVALPVKFYCHFYFQQFRFEWYTSIHCPIQSPVSHFLQCIVVQCFTVFLVWHLFLSATHMYWDFPSSLACVTGILDINCSLPTNLLASLLVWPWVWIFRTALASNPLATFS
jgi:hypothetical protein